MKRSALTFILFVFSVTFVVARPPHVSGLPRFKTLAKAEHFRHIPTERLCMVADTVLAYQFPSGGWSKNHRWELCELSAEEWQSRLELREAIATTGVGSNIDNGATTSEIMFLAKVYRRTGVEAYRESALRGIGYLLAMQYDNGGWPQFWPSRPSGYDGVEPYADFITFNDDAMVNVMRLLWSVADERAPYSALRPSDELRGRCRMAFDRGVQCILDCQIRKAGMLTVWCQQHDPLTLAPQHARSYELPSFTGCGETCSILDLLMDLPNPSARVVESVTAAVHWLEAHPIHDRKLSFYRTADGERDYRLVESLNAPLLWARFYDLETEQPYYCDRDGVKRDDVSDLCRERRMGYSWLSRSPSDIIARYNKWMRGKGGKAALATK